MTLRVIGTAAIEPIKWPTLEKANGHTVEDALLYRRPTTFDNAETVETPRYDRGKLLAGHEFDGPAIVVQHNSTTVIPMGYRARVSDYGNIHIGAK